MKNNTFVLLLATALSLGIMTCSHAEQASVSDKSEDSSKESKSNSALWDRVEKARADAQEEKALAEKAWAEANLKEAILKKQATEKIFNAQLEIEMAKEAQKVAEFLANRAKANAELAEAQLREMKAKTELQAMEQASASICEAQAAKARVEKLESELKLAKVQNEKDKFFKGQN